jgi:hypothetical protein
MRTISVNLFRINELSAEAKEKALEKHRDWNVQDEWYDFVVDAWKEKLDAIGFEHAEIHFSGFSSQGDGACFDAHCNMDKLLKSYYPKELVDFIVEYFDLSAKINTVNHHYSHENTRDFNLVWDCPNSFVKVMDVSTESLPLLIGTVEEYAQKLLDIRIRNQIGPIDLKEFEKDIEENRTSLCRELYRELEDAYESLTTDEAVTESLEANEKEFTEDGKDA